MEKINDLQQHQISDDELEEVGGGKKLFNIFTTEFKEFFDGPEKQRNPLDDEDEDETFGVKTLEMRINPNKKRKNRNTNKVMKL